ncbi:hypothetical protein [Nitrincola sp. A-D6]|uniref:hypothetical protein n=1 Tax=Nitrincola sp. A-D6 TaxID=1545442 RepID=UPI0011865259|nr:hypothetical protein [Nitrincola sp. A-D6]
MNNENAPKATPKKPRQQGNETLTVNLSMTVPPSPYTAWNEEALKAYAEARGFAYISSDTNERNIANIKGKKA